MERKRDLMNRYYSIGEQKGRCFFIKPSGEKLYSLGVNCVTINDVDVEGIIEKYGDDGQWFERWADNKLRQIMDLGFNTLAAWHHPYYWGNGFPKTVELRMTKYAKKVNTEWGVGFPDVFDRSFKMSIHKVLVEHFYGNGGLLEKDEGVIGYYTDNELHWWGRGGFWGCNKPGGTTELTELVDDYIELGAECEGKKAWVRFIKDRYKTIDHLNKAWRSEYAEFDDLLHLMHYTADEDVIELDKKDFLRIIAYTYFKTTGEALKQYDPYRLNLGCRFVGATTPKPVLEIMNEFVDVISINFYDSLEKYKGYLTSLHSITGKPVMITEFSFCAGREAGYLSSTNGAQSVMVKDQKRRAECYEAFVMSAYSLPFVIGTHWFALYDFANNVHGLIGNYGLLDAHDRIWEEFAEGVKMVHQRLGEL